MAFRIFILACSVCFVGVVVLLHSGGYSMASGMSFFPKEKVSQGYHRVVPAQDLTTSRLGFYEQHAFGIKLSQNHVFEMGKGLMRWEPSGGTVSERRVI
jgi:hypothetical protein